MLGPAQSNLTCSICCINTPATIIPNRSSSSSSGGLYTIRERGCDTIITCYHCKGEMACIPHTMQIVRAQKKKYSQSSESTAPKSKYFNFQEMTKPYRYSSKEMNAIWGMYNKDSVHNFKSNRSSNTLALDSVDNYKSMAHDGVTAAEIHAVVQGADIVLGNQDMVQQQQIQEQLFQQKFKQQDFGDLGKAVSNNFYFF